MKVDLAAVASAVAAVKATGAPIARQLDEADRLRSEVFDQLRPYSAEFGNGPRSLPASDRARLAASLEAVSGMDSAAARSIDDAFGAGSWMAQAARQSGGFAGEARRVLADERGGVHAADQAIDLLRRNGWAYDQARFSLRDGDLRALTNPRGGAQIDLADADAFASAAAHALRLARVA